MFKKLFPLACIMLLIASAVSAEPANHAKLMAFIGERFSGVIESSANVDTNPRIEQTCITIHKELAEFYKAFFDQMKDYDGRYQDWTPWADEE